MHFTRRGNIVRAQLDAYESELVREWAGGLITLLGEDTPVSEDPLAALVGMSDGPVERPEDPALRRLLPDGYGDDEDAAREFRHFTEGDLRRGKREHAEVVRNTAPTGGGTVRLDRSQADAWLGWLNDMRLVLATRLDLPQDSYPEDVATDDPDRHAHLVYHWLTANQYELLKALDR